MTRGPSAPRGATPRGRLGTLACAAALAAVLTAGPAARADVAVFDDSGDVATSVDILKVRVDNAATDPNRVRVRIGHADLVFGDEVTIYVDLRAKNPGPEWKITGRPSAEWALLRIGRWAADGRDLPCAEGSMRSDEARDFTRLVLPFSCVGAPSKRVRVAVKVTRDQTSAVDWAPAARTFLPWVRPGAATEPRVAIGHRAGDQGP